MVVVETLKSNPFEVPLALGVLGLIFYLFGNRPQSNKLWNRIPNVWGNISSRQQRESTFIKNSRETYREGYRRVSFLQSNAEYTADLTIVQILCVPSDDY